MDIKYKKIKPNAVVPTYATEGSAGFDLYATEEVVIKPQETKVIGTGLEVECPEDMAIMVFPRSGMSAKTPLRLANGVGVIDSDYRGELKVILYNSSATDLRIIPKYQLTDGSMVEAYDHDYVPYGTVVIKKGDRIAQGVLMDITQADFKEVNKFSEEIVNPLIQNEKEQKAQREQKVRGKGGLGSTGK